MGVFRKDPEGLIDYKVVWDSWLGNDNIVSAQASAGGTITTSSIRIANSTVSAGKSHVVWLSAGTLDTEYTIRSKIWTSGGRKNLQSFIVRIENR